VPRAHAAGFAAETSGATRTYDQWREADAVEVAVDCVGHDGGSTRGEYNQKQSNILVNCSQQTMSFAALFLAPLLIIPLASRMRSK
jgi:hypothetical protein